MAVSENAPQLRLCIVSSSEKIGGMTYKFFILIACPNKCSTHYCLDKSNYLLSRWMKVSKRHGKIDG